MYHEGLPLRSVRRHSPGLRVAYLAEKSADSPSAGPVIAKLVDEAAAFESVDFLITNEWPQGVTSGLQGSELPSELQSLKGSKAVALLAQEIQPR